MKTQFRKVDAAMRLGDYELVLNSVKSATHNTIVKEGELYVNLLVMAGLSAKALRIEGNYFLNEALLIYSEKTVNDGIDMFNISNKTAILCYMDRKEEALGYLNGLTVNEENQAKLDELKLSLETLDAATAVNNLLLKQ